MAQLTFAQKVAIVYNLIIGDTPESIAAEHNRTVDEINFIARNHWSIVEVSHFFNNVKHMPVKGGLYPLMENILFCWYVEQQNVTNKQLAEKAKMILDVLNEQPRFASQNLPVFTASHSWIAGFKARFNIATTTRKSTSRETDTPTTGSSEDNEEKTYSSSSSSPKENFFVIDESSEEEARKLLDANHLSESKSELSVTIKEKIGNENKTQESPLSEEDDRRKNIESDMNQKSTDSTIIIAGNENGTVNENASAVSLGHNTGQYVQDSTDDFSAGNAEAFTGLKYENLQIESVVSLAEGTDLVKNIDIDAEITQVNQGSTDFRNIAVNADDTHKRSNSTYDNLKIESVVSLAQNGDHVQSVVADGKTAKVVQKSNYDCSDFVGEENTHPAKVIIDLTESDDDTLSKEKRSRGAKSKKRKRSITDEISFLGEPKRSRRRTEQFRH